MNPNNRWIKMIDASTLVLFRKRINDKILMDANEAMLATLEEEN